KKGNALKNEGGVVVIPPAEDEEVPFTLVEKDMHDEDEGEIDENENDEARFQPPVQPVVSTKPSNQNIPPKPSAPLLELEIKTAEAIPVQGNELEENLYQKGKASPLPDYEPTLDLSNYKYPSIDLLESHGSEKIIQDASELETNKNQIISTLKNYDIDIQ